MHKTCVTPTPDLGEGWNSSAYVPCFPFKPVVDKKESFQFSSGDYLFSVSSKLEQFMYIYISFTPIKVCPCGVMSMIGLCNLLYVLWKFQSVLHVRESSIRSPK